MSNVILENNSEKRQRGKYFGFALILVGVLIAVVTLVGGNLPARASDGDVADFPKAPLVGSLAPEFALMDIHGNEVVLSEVRGKRIMLNFWATWCAPCRLEMPYLQAEFEKYQGDLLVMAINFDEPLDQVAAFANELGLTFDMLLDPEGTIQELYEIRGYPSTYFINEEGVIEVVHIGIMSKDQLQGYLNQIGLQ